MANLLSTATSVNNAVKAAQNINVTGNDLQNVGINAAFSAASAIAIGGNPLAAAANSAIGAIPGAPTIASAANSVLGALGSPLAGAIGGLSGTKPKALHTEYASGSANWSKPYGAGTDITFYLMRADGGGGGSGEAAVLGDDPFGIGEVSEKALNSSLSSAADAVVPADVAAGVGLPDGMSSVLNQVASASSIASSVGSLAASVPGLAGPMSGLTEGLSMANGVFSSATAALTNPTASNIASALGSTAAVTDAFGVTSGLSNTIENSVAGSEAFFNETLDNAFNAGGIVEGLAKVPTSEFSTLLASTTKGITSTSAFIAGINDGSLGFTSISSAAEAARTGPQGTPKKKS